MSGPAFLTLAEVLEIHKDQVERYGGAHGIRDIGLVESAIAMPQAGFGGKYLHGAMIKIGARNLDKRGLAEILSGLAR